MVSPRSKSAVALHESYIFLSNFGIFREKARKACFN
jgi:hypothetical protein